MERKGGFSETNTNTVRQMSFAFKIMGEGSVIKIGEYKEASLKAIPPDLLCFNKQLILCIASLYFHTTNQQIQPFVYKLNFDELKYQACFSSRPAIAKTS